MSKTSTLFYFYDNINIENELYESKDLTEPSYLFKKELNEIFRGIEYSPGEEVLRKILNEI